MKERRMKKKKQWTKNQRNIEKWKKRKRKAKKLKEKERNNEIKCFIFLLGLLKKLLDLSDPERIRTPSKIHYKQMYS